MRYTLIPIKYRTLLHHEYHIRVISILLLALAVAFAVGAGALFPAFMSSWLAARSIPSVAATVANDQKAGSLADTEQELAADAALASGFSADAGMVKFSDILRSIIAGSRDVSITSFDLDRQSSSTVVAVITGVAPTRDSLLMWKSSLEKIAPGASVDLPIAELAESDNIQFSVKFTENLP